MTSLAMIALDSSLRFTRAHNISTESVQNQSSKEPARFRRAVCQSASRSITHAQYHQLLGSRIGRVRQKRFLTRERLNVSFVIWLGSCSSSVLSLQQFSQCTVWVNELLRDIGLFELRGSVSHIKKVNSLSHLWINAYWRREPFQTIQFDLVNWFKKIRLHRVIRSWTRYHETAVLWTRS